MNMEILPWLIILLISGFVMLFITTRSISGCSLTVKIPAGVLDFIVFVSFVLVLVSFYMAGSIREEAEPTKAQVEQNEK